MGGGCFWCIEACYNMMKGVQSAVSGYAAGQVDNPTYKQVGGDEVKVPLFLMMLHGVRTGKWLPGFLGPRLVR